MKRGYIRVWRKIFDNPLSNKPAYMWLWLSLLLLVNHKSKEIMWNGEIIIIREGQLLTGRKELSRQTGIPESTIEDILKTLEKLKEVNPENQKLEELEERIKNI